MKQLLFLVSLIWIAGCNSGGDSPSKPQETIIPGAEPPRALTFSIIKTYPHDTSSYTQGLQVYNGELYEGTGNYGHSRLIKVDLNTGKAIQSISLDPRFFGEGITILRDTIYQLTWKERKVLVYTLKDFKKVKEYDLGTDGWGLTTDGKDLIASDGSSTLYYYDPNGFKLLRTQTITEAGSLSYNLNELEYIDGFIYANQYQAPYILKIDPGSGHIVAKADLTAIWKRVQTIDPAADVPNGIAYDSATGKFYITGKLWPELYEIAFSK
ncbi:MAG: glutaminyl-peptide cyclotransferase [Sphingobacteriales bacterium]|nr:glutaminyl-peptide cyclotransferase [Sphingobacteriales bacterium]OJW37887.1 MAG: glutamine cyclotransferase [Sphingobacteriales bacterium 46-32]